MFFIRSFSAYARTRVRDKNLCVEMFCGQNADFSLSGNFITPLFEKNHTIIL